MRGLRSAGSCRVRRARPTLALCALVAAAISCARAAPAANSEPVTVDVVRTSAGHRVRLIASEGVRINARIKPALELEDGTVLRMDADAITSDSAYFAEPPHAALSGTRTRVAGLLRVSVCVAAASYCQSLEVPVDERIAQ